MVVVVGVIDDCVVYFVGTVGVGASEMCGRVPVDAEARVRVTQPNNPDRPRNQNNRTTPRARRRWRS